MRLVEFIVPSYEVPARKINGKVEVGHHIPEQRIAIASEAIVAIEAPELPGEEVRVRTATHYWDVGGTFDEVVALWIAARTEAQP